ncbi:hypothetical protein [Chelatococcus sambhunathii]|uniref:hypothetical protein n=1 Tax=Chelatococcus sambhunathii TaxID=363953 RepID=UPI002852982B|nr:hypothetical protein [Chelatococcus sambhunathii]
MEVRDHRREARRKGVGEPTDCGHLGEQILLGEAAHLDDAVHKLSGSVEFEPSRRSRDAKRLSIERRRSSAVEREFALAVFPPNRRIGEIDVGQSDRALQFPHALAAQKDDGDVGPPLFDRLDELTLQEGDRLGLTSFRRHRSRCPDRRRSHWRVRPSGSPPRRRRSRTAGRSAFGTRP